jgi:hypothetical protein
MEYRGVSGPNKYSTIEKDGYNYELSQHVLGQLNDVPHNPVMYKLNRHSNMRHIDLLPNKLL